MLEFKLIVKNQFQELLYKTLDPGHLFGLFVTNWGWKPESTVMFFKLQLIVWDPSLENAWIPSHVLGEQNLPNNVSHFSARNSIDHVWAYIHLEDAY